jgi:RHS repeat-associated protein
VACHYQLDAQPCWSPETITDDQGDGFATSGQPGLWMDQSTGRLYVYATRTSDQTGGVVCIDTTEAATNSDPFCGFTALTGVGEAPLQDGISAISDPALVGSDWYAFNYVNGSSLSPSGTPTENTLLCFNTSTLSACPSQPFSIDASAGSVDDGDYPPPAVAAIASQVIIPITTDGQDQLACFDDSTQGSCSGSWPIALDFGYDSSAGAPFPTLDSNSHVSGFCLPSSGLPCWDLSGNSLSTPNGMAAAIAPNTGWNGPGVVIGSRVYVPNGDYDQVDCYDYTSQSSCVNFPKTFNGLGLLYTVNLDPERPTCIWVNSDNGTDQIQNFDGYSGLGCGQFAPEASTALGSSEAALHSTGCVSGQNPIDCASGDFWHSFTDADVSGPGIDIDLTRTYNSLNASESGIFGYGWSSSYDQHITFNSDGSITVTLADGSQMTAESDGTGGYSFPPWTGATLITDGSGGYTLIEHATTTLTFTSSGQLSSIADLNGYGVTLAYNSSGYLDSVTDSFGRTLVVNTNSSGLVTSITDPMGRTTTYSYDSSGNLVAVTDPLNRKWQFSYDSNHLLLTMTDPNGGVVTNTYDSTGRVLSQTDPAGLTTTYSYVGDNFSADGGTTTITDPHGNVEVQNYIEGFLVSLTKGSGTPQAGTWTYQYDANSLGTTSVTDPNGNTTTTEYDISGNPLSTTDALGNTTTDTYNILNEPLTVTDPLGGITSYTYDGNGNTLSMTDPDSYTTNWAYGDSSLPGLPTSVTDPDGRVTSYTYDTDGLVASKTTYPSTSSQDTTQYAYDTDGEQTCEVSPNETAASVTCASNGSRVAGSISTAYDADGEVTSQADAAGNVTTYTYDANGNQLSVTDPSGNETTYQHDADNRLVSTTAGAGSSTVSTTKYSYDIIPGSGSCSSSVSNVTYCTTTTDPNGNVTTDFYNSRDELIEEARPDAISTTYSYDSDGNVVSLTDSSGRTTNYIYNADNELTNVDYSDGTTPDVSYAYDADGNRMEMSDGTGSTTYQYDADARLTSETNGAGASVSYGYDGAGLVTGITYPNGKTVSKTYDGTGELASITDWNNQTTSFTYDADGNLISTSYPNGDTVASTYNSQDQVLTEALGGAATAGISYSRNADGLVTSETDSGALTGNTSYEYNSQNEVVSAGSETFGYDPGGNLTNLNGTTQTFNSADELTASSGSSGSGTFSYDVEGDLTSSAVPSATYTYNQASQLTSAIQPPTVPAMDRDSSRSGLSDAVRPNSGTAPVISSIAPSAGPTTGGTKVTIDGTGFKNVKSVTFGSKTAKFKVVNARSVTATSPKGSKGDVLVWVTTSVGPSNTVKFAYITGPYVYSISPSTGPADGGTSVVITGFNFTSVKSVKFGSASAKFTVTNSKSIIAIAPAVSGSTSTVSIVVKASSGTSVSDSGSEFTYVPTYVYNGDGLRMSTESGGALVPLAWDTNTTTPEVIQSGSTYFIYGPEGLPIEQISSSGTDYFVHDSVGSTRILVSSSGSIAATFTYSPYGSVSASTGTATTPLTFAGYYWDSHSGLYYVANRSYDPATGQFTTVDPMLTGMYALGTGTSQGLDVTISTIALTNLSPYQYANGDPINEIDPSGLWGFDVCLGVCLSYQSHNGWGVGRGLGADVDVGSWSAGTPIVSVVKYAHTDTISAQVGFNVGPAGVGIEVNYRKGRWSAYASAGAGPVSYSAPLHWQCIKTLISTPSVLPPLFY